MFWYGWNSWVVEILGGLVLSGVMYLAWGNVLGAAIASVVASLLYERFADVNGFEWEDVGQRQVGIMLGLAVWPLVFHLWETL